MTDRSSPDTALLIERLRRNADDCENMERWATPELAPLLRRAADVIEAVPAQRPASDLAERIRLYLDDHPGDGGHSDAAGASAWELLDEAMEELKWVTAQSTLVAAAERVCWFDWSSNDPTAAETIEQLRRALSSTEPAQRPAAWLIKWNMKQSGPQVSAYISEDDARRAASNVSTYAHATDVVVFPAYAAPVSSTPRTDQ